MKKALLITLLAIGIGIVGYFTFVYYVPYSTGVRSGELIKISHKGVIVKTWEGEISQGISGAQIFPFSVSGSRTDLIEKLKEYQGAYVKLEYEERFRSFFWWGDTKYFITAVDKGSRQNRNQ